MLLQYSCIIIEKLGVMSGAWWIQLRGEGSSNTRRCTKHPPIHPHPRHPLYSLEETFPGLCTLYITPCTLRVATRRCEESQEV